MRLSYDDRERRREAAGPRLDLRAGHRDARLTLYRARRAARSSSAPARSSGPGASTPTTTAAARAADPRMQQATVNLFADMGVQPATLQPASSAASASTDTTAADARRSPSPAAGTTVAAGSAVTITGTATDAGGGGSPASRSRPTAAPPGTRPTGARAWTLHLDPDAPRPVTSEPRGRRQRATSSAAPAPHVRPSAAAQCPCTLVRRATPPSPRRPRRHADRGSASSSESTIDGTITGLRFYKGAGTDGHPRRPPLDRDGTLLATATFASESATGWQQVVARATPVRDHRQHDLRRLLPRPRRVLRTTTRLLRRLRFDPRPCGRQDGEGQGVYTYGERLPDHQPTTRPTTGSTSSSTRPRPSRRRRSASLAARERERRASTRRRTSPSPFDEGVDAATAEQPAPSSCATRRGALSPPTSPTTPRAAPPRCGPGRRWPGRPRTPPPSRAAPSASPTSSATPSPRTARGRSPTAAPPPGFNGPGEVGTKGSQSGAGSGSAQHGSTSSAAKRLSVSRAHRPGVEERDGQAARGVSARARAAAAVTAQAPGRSSAPSRPRR